MKETQFTIHFTDSPGFVIRIAMLLERRGYEIRSLKIKKGFQGDAHMHLLVTGDPARHEQVVKQLQKLVDVTAVEETPEVRVASGTAMRQEALAHTR